MIGQDRHIHIRFMTMQAKYQLSQKAANTTNTTNTTVSKDYNYAAFNNNMGVSFLGGSLVLNSGTDLKLYYGNDLHV